MLIKTCISDSVDENEGPLHGFGTPDCSSSKNCDCQRITLLVPKVTAIDGDSFLPVSDGKDEISEKALATATESGTATSTGIEITTVIPPVKKQLPN